MRVIVVDENDKQVGAKEYEDMQKTDIYRCAGLWLTDSNGRILLARRSFDKHHDPGCWSNAVAGTVEDGETYETNIYKEAQEEIGLSGIRFDLGPKVLNDSNYIFFVQWFSGTVDWPVEKFKLQKDEVAAIKWVDKKWLLDDLATSPDNYVAGASKVWTEFLK